MLAHRLLAGPASNQPWFNASCLLGAAFNPVNTKYLYNICTMLGQSRRRWADIVQMLYKCFVFAGNSSWSGIADVLATITRRHHPMSVKCCASDAGAGQYPFSPSQYFMLRYLHVFCFFLLFFQIPYIYTFTVHTIYSTEQKKRRQYVRHDKKKKKKKKKKKYDIYVRCFYVVISG